MKALAVWWVVGLVIICGCVRRVYVPVHDVEREVYKESRGNSLADTVIVVKSCSVTVKGDTVREVKENNVWRRSVVRDTLRVVHVDTVFKESVVPASEGRSAGCDKRVWILCGAVTALLAVLWLGFGRQRRT